MRSAVLVLLAPLLLSGCVLWGDDPQLARDPNFEGPHFILLVENEAAEEAAFEWTLFGPAERVVAEGALAIPPGETAREPISLHEIDSGRLAVTFEWIVQGQVAADEAEVAFDDRACLDPVHVVFVIGEGADGPEFTRADATCPEG